MFEVTYHDTLTGRFAVEKNEYDFFRFVWEEGSASCDCNRGAWFFRALTGRDECEASAEEAERFGMVDVGDGWQFPCNHGDPRFLVEIRGEDGALFYDDGETPHTLRTTLPNSLI